jgi:hypothetical protein
VGFEPDALSRLAIYATQKLRRIAAFAAGVGRVDPFTETLVKNARGTEGVLTGRAARASLSTKVDMRDGIQLAHRRISTDGTASSQAGSSRQALAALGIATLGRDGRESVLNIDLEHPLLAKVGV